eukprot:TRINITY_DN2330_c0_g1_i3.p1 TRINITY_DN2330_c0_g1~~TRINITY_DN2330_c0_g1_i3.p1  ORF type:complete len:228 (+),score=56.37 TRINITY_DN2330_c0_g1_i3:353-1036(+)
MLIEVECTDHLQKTQAEITVLREKLRVSQQEIASLKSRVQEHQSHTDEQVAAAIHSMKAEHRVVVDALVREFETERRALALEGIKNAEMLSQAQLRFEAAVDLHVSVEEAHRRAVDMAGSNAVSMFLVCSSFSHVAVMSAVWSVLAEHKAVECAAGLDVLEVLRARQMVTADRNAPAHELSSLEEFIECVASAPVSVRQILRQVGAVVYEKDVQEMESMEKTAWKKR